MRVPTRPEYFEFSNILERKTISPKMAYAYIKKKKKTRNQFEFGIELMTRTSAARRTMVVEMSV